MKKKGSNFILILIFLAGLSLLLYPTVSNFWNSLHQSYAIAQYEQLLDDAKPEQYTQMLEQAQQYNRHLLERTNEFGLSEEQKQQYDSILNLSGNGIMAYVDIPCIDCRLPIYHGTDEAVLQVAIGHIEWSSLPVGGTGTHSVISGHRGLPSAELLSHIDRLTVGDAFYIHVLGEKLKYRVDDIAVVLPDDTSRLRVVEGEDYVTLVTCTPYGINSHRLLVRGTRVQEDAAQSNDMQLTNEIRVISPVYVLPIVFAALAAGAALVIGIRRHLKRRIRHGKREQKKS
ncbi:MAG: class C sortase [Oscillospiraceae bacterium]|nr:class C sortase [Oscillospiraceae bacterium]